MDKNGFAKKGGSVAKKNAKEKKKIETPVSKKKDENTRLSRALSRDSASSVERKGQIRKTRSTSHSAQKPKVLANIILQLKLYTACILHC